MIQIVLPLDGYEGTEDETLIAFAFQLALLEWWDLRPIEMYTRPHIIPEFEKLSMRETMAVEITADYLHLIIKRILGARLIPPPHPPRVAVKKTRHDLFLEIL